MNMQMWTNGGLKVFTRQLATMQNDGEPIIDSLQSLTNSMTDGPVKDALTGIIKEVKLDTPLSEAFGKEPDLFDNLYLSFIKAGEKGKAMEVALLRLAEYLEKNHDGSLAQSLWAFGFMVSVGVPILDCLSLTAGVCKKEAFKLLWLDVRKNIREGGTITEVLEKSLLIHRAIVKMIAEGEETGDLDTQLLKAAKLCEV